MMKEKCHIFENISNYTIRYDGSNLYLKLEYPDVDKEHLTNLTDIKCINEVDLQEIIDEQRRKKNTDQVIKKDSKKFIVVYIINVFVLK